MSTYSERYENLIGPIIEEHNRYCEKIAEMGYTKLGLREYDFISRTNPEYYQQLHEQYMKTGSCTIDSNELKVFDTGMAKLYEKQKAKKAAEADK